MNGEPVKGCSRGAYWIIGLDDLCNSADRNCCLPPESSFYEEVNTIDGVGKSCHYICDKTCDKQVKCKAHTSVQRVISGTLPARLLVCG